MLVRLLPVRVSRSRLVLADIVPEFAYSPDNFLGVCLLFFVVAMCCGYLILRVR